MDFLIKEAWIQHRGGRAKRWSVQLLDGGNGRAATPVFPDAAMVNDRKTPTPFAS